MRLSMHCWTMALISMQSAHDRVTPLELAACSGHKDVVLTLISRGADVANTLFCGIISLWVGSAPEADVDALLVIIDAGGTGVNHALSEASSWARTDVVRDLLRRGDVPGDNEGARLLQAALSELFHRSTSLDVASRDYEPDGWDFGPQFVGWAYEASTYFDKLLRRGDDNYVRNDKQQSVLDLCLGDRPITRELAEIALQGLAKRSGIKRVERNS
jgi:ankyrin repeat protein